MSRFRKARIAVLLLVLAVAGLRWMQVRRAEQWRPPWTHSESVALVLLVPQGASAEEHAAVDWLREFAVVGSNKATFWALRDWFEAEYARYLPAKKGFSPVVFDVIGPLVVETPPPAPPRASDDLSFLERWSRSSEFFRWYDALAPRIPSTSPSKLFVYFFPPSIRKTYADVHSVSDRRSRRGFIFVPLDARGFETTLTNVAHETLHIFGATDKYEGDRCVYPQGYADPFRPVDAPQSHAEVMAMGFPSRTEREKPLEFFEQMRVGVATAEEVGWIDAERRARYYGGDPRAGPEE